MQSQRAEKRDLRRERVRRKALGTDSRPRLSIYRSLHHIYAQVISDQSGRPIAAAATQSGAGRSALSRKRRLAAAKAVGKAIAEKCRDAGIDSVVFDRNGFLYHGRVKALADAAREAGLKF
jgi:large subunit ribosomal protein L18